jgi:hypothetical protein
MLPQASDQRVRGSAYGGLKTSFKYVFSLGKHLLIDGDVDDFEQRQAGEDCAVVLEIGFEAGGSGARTVDVTERNHRLRIAGRAREEYGESIHEVSEMDGRVPMPRTISASKQLIAIDAEGAAEKIKFFAFGRQIPVLGMGKNEIETHEFRLDGRGLTPAPVGVVVVGHQLVQGAGTKG